MDKCNVNTIEATAQKVISKIESIEDMLAEILPDTDVKHKDEVLDICSLLRQRVEMYIKNYGVNDGVEV